MLFCLVHVCVCVYLYVCVGMHMYMCYESVCVRVIVIKSVYVSACVCVHIFVLLFCLQSLLNSSVFCFFTPSISRISCSTIPSFLDSFWCSDVQCAYLLHHCISYKCSRLSALALSCVTHSFICSLFLDQ
jgi:hypothetical protein